MKTHPPIPYYGHPVRHRPAARALALLGLVGLGIAGAYLKHQVSKPNQPSQRYLREQAEIYGHSTILLGDDADGPEEQGTIDEKGVRCISIRPALLATSPSTLKLSSLPIGRGENPSALRSFSVRVGAGKTVFLDEVPEGRRLIAFMADESTLRIGQPKGDVELHRADSFGTMVADFTDEDSYGLTSHRLRGLLQDSPVSKEAPVYNAILQIDKAGPGLIYNLIGAQLIEAFPRKPAPALTTPGP